MKRYSGKISSRKTNNAFSAALSIPGLNSSTSGILLLIAVLLLLVSTLAPNMLSALRMSAADATAPVLNVVSTPIQKAAIFIRDVTGLAQIQAENARLTQENIKLREWYQTALLLEAENKSLRELMNVKVDPTHSYITARVLSDNASTFAKSLLVSAGTTENVQKNQAVIAGDGLVGRVVETGESTARILLITDINSRVPVMIEGSRQHAIFSGRNMKDGMLIHVPEESRIREGSRIVTSGIGGIFPVGLPVGIVREVGETIMVEPFANFDRLMHVRIVNRPDDPNLRPGALLKN